MADTYSHLEHANDFEPSAGHHQLLAHHPLYRQDDHDPPFYVLSRFDDVVAAVKQPALWRNGDGPGIFYQQGGVLGSADDPDHARHRRALRAAFVPTAIATLEPAIGALADEVLDTIVPRGEGDFVELFAFPFPALVIGELLGVRPEDRSHFRDWSVAIVNALGGGDMDAYRIATKAIWDYVDGLVAEREAVQHAGGTLPDDVLTRMMSAQGDGVLTGDEIRRLSHQLLVAGHETTTSLIGLLLYRLIERPELMARLRDDPELIEAAIEEALRFDSPVQGLFRTNASECPVRGETIPAGTKMQLLYAAANRDPERWEAPDEFRIDRPERDLASHLGFGWGIHYCIGAPLARLETRVTFERVLQRMGDIELTGDPQVNETFVLRGFTRLPLRWRPR